MQQEKFSLLRSLLKALGLSAEAIDDIIERILDFLSDRDAKSSTLAEFPYFLRDDFLSPAEHSFYLVLKTTVGSLVQICPKVSLADLFYAKHGDPSRYRSLTNKIDRKHVDFVLCDPQTLRPLAGVELDDNSHQRADRQVRDEFVERVFAAAKLPLIRVPARRAYNTAEIEALVRQVVEQPKAESEITHAPSVVAPNTSIPQCPKCGSKMVLRTAKSGANQGEKFWGCSSFPHCRGILKYEGQGA